MTPHPITRRSFISLAASAAAALPVVSRAAETPLVLGQGDFRYRVVPGWGEKEKPPTILPTWQPHMM